MGIFYLIFTAVQLISMFIDPCFFCVLVIDDHMKCIDLVISSAVALVVLRSVFDGFQLVYLFYSQKNYDHDPHYFTEGSRCYHLKMWAKKYIPSVIGMLSILPLPQVVLFIVVPQMRDSKFLTGMSLMVFLVLAQSPLRFICLYLLFSKARNSSVLLQLPSGLDNAIFYFLIYLLAGLNFGALWYFLSNLRLSECWKEACRQAGCRHDSFHCNSNFGDQSRFQIDALCSMKTSNPTITDYGMFEDAIRSGIVQVKKLLPKLLYSFQWGTRSLSFAQDYQTSTSSWENIFSSVITISGAVLISFLLWNVTQFLQNNRISERNIRMHMQEIERWGLFQKLFENLKKEIRKYYRKVYHGTEDFRIDDFFNNLPWELIRDMKRQLCLPLLKKEGVFAEMDEEILNALLKHFKLVVYTEGRVLVHEGSPVNELLVIVDGEAQSSATSSVSSVYGAELIQSALGNIPQGSSRQTIKAVTTVVAFSIEANDLKQFVNLYRLPNGQLSKNFEYHRNLADIVMQMAWHNWKKRKLQKTLHVVGALSPIRAEVT